MSAADRITLVLRPHTGTTLEDLQQYAKLGMPVGVGRSLGVIAGASEGDVVERAEQLESQVVIAEAACWQRQPCEHTLPRAGIRRYFSYESGFSITAI
ncbi:hypothetical protein ACI2KS_23780 [Pseudomonas sp. NPDC087358]|uniref:hypothetical protein n=1 Tax=Pseudomonas sp. NPDC087358 TaxID=3364439 RepID=UPI00384D2D16